MGEVARFDTRFRQRIWRICLASAAMGAVLWGVALALGPLLHTPFWRYPALAVLLGLGMLSYFGCGQAFGAFKLREFRSVLRRGGA